MLSYIRRDGDEFVAMVFNFTPVPRYNYRIGVPEPGRYREIFNSDSVYYGGSNVGNPPLEAEAREWMGRPYALTLTLPPLAGIILVREDVPEPSAATEATPASEPNNDARDE